MTTLQKELQRLSGTTRDIVGAANAWAGTTGLDVTGALNVKAGNTSPNLKSLQGVLNQLAGTSGYAETEAARRCTP